MIEQLAEWDREWFIFFNSYHHPFWDTFMTYMSSRIFWVPMYMVILSYLIYFYRRQSILMIGAILVAVSLADLISYRFFKPYFGRLRPCYDESLAEVIHIVDGCGGRFGFLSSHAATTFAFAATLCLLLDRRYWVYKGFILLWASVISFSRIYLGVHYPGDVLAGALLGILLGLLATYFYRLAFNRFSWFHR
ncbi:lipid A 4'-phosphatase [soil metagenome]